MEVPSAQGNSIDGLRDLLRRDQSARHRRFPDQALFALRDERVVTAIQNRLQRGGRLTRIRALDYNFHTGLNHLVFEFLPGEGVAVQPDAMMVMMNGACGVVGMLEAFDYVQPNPAVPPLPETTEQVLTTGADRSQLPFVLSRPSAAQGLRFTEQDLYPLEVRNREFFRKLAPDGSLARSAGDTNSPATTLRSAIIIAVPENFDEPILDVDTNNDDV